MSKGGIFQRSGTFSGLGWGLGGLVLFLIILGLLLEYCNSGQPASRNANIANTQQAK